MEEAVGFQAADLRIAGAEVEVDEAVVVEVGDAGAHDADGEVEAGLVGDVGEGAVSVVAEQAADVGVHGARVGGSSRRPS